MTRGKLLAVLIGVVVIVVALWLGAWFGGAALLKNYVTEPVADAVVPAPVTCAGRQIVGFPFSLKLSCDATAATDPRSGLVLHAAGLTSDAPLFNPGHVDTAVTGPVSVDGPAGMSLVARFDTANASADASPLGLSRSTAAVGPLRVALSLPDRMVNISAASASASLASSSRIGDSLRLEADAADLTVTHSGGRALPPLTAALRLDLAGTGSRVGRDPRAQLAAWLANGARVEIEQAKAALGGTTVSASGRLSVGTTGLLSGRITVRVVGLDKLPALAESIDPGSGRKIEQSLKLAAALMKPVDTPDGPGREIDLALREGTLIAGIFPLPVSIPPLPLPR